MRTARGRKSHDLGWDVKVRVTGSSSSISASQRSLRAVVCVEETFGVQELGESHGCGFLCYSVGDGERKMWLR